MAIGKIETEQQLLDFVREELIGTLPTRLENLIGLVAGIRGGVATAVFTASDTSAQVTIPHGLPKAPTKVLAMAKDPVAGRVHIQESAPPDGTNIYLKGFQSAGTAVSISQDFYWLAVG